MNDPNVQRLAEHIRREIPPRPEAPEVPWQALVIGDEQPEPLWTLQTSERVVWAVAGAVAALLGVTLWRFVAAAMGG